MRETRNVEGCDAQMQAERVAFVKQMQADRLIGRTSINGDHTVATVFVPEGFILHTLKDQYSFLNVVYAYWVCETNGIFGQGYDFLRVKIDDGTARGKSIRIFDPVRGVRDD